jgi:hypothetical protein
VAEQSGRGSIDSLAAMATILSVVAFLLVLSVLVPTAFALIVRNRLHHRNRVSPRVRTDAPLGWLWSPAFAARLHRRLQRAAGLARSVVALHQRSGGQTRLVEMARTLEREAVALDERLALIGRLHVSQRRRAMPDLLAEVTRIEQVALRLSMQQVDQRIDARLAEQSSAVQQLTIELDALDEANEVLRKVEADAGLHRPAPLRLPAPAARPSPYRSRSGPGTRRSPSSRSQAHAHGAYATEPATAPAPAPTGDPATEPATAPATEPVTELAADRNAGTWPAGR